MALTAKRMAFVREYLVDGSATQAAIRAGYNPKTAGQQGWRLTQDPDVAAAISAGQQECAERSAVTVDWIIERLHDVAVSSTRGDSVRALELLGKHLGMFREGVDVKHSGGVTVVLNGHEANL